MAVSISPNISMTANETVTLDSASDATITQSGFNLSGVRLNSASTPAVTKSAYHDYAFTAGAVTIDLTALADAVNVAFSGTGLKVQTVIIKNPTGNGAITLVPGAANPYNLFGAAFKIIIPAGSWVGAYMPEGTPDVAGGAKNIDVTGTGTETFYIGFTLG